MADRRYNELLHATSFRLMEKDCPAPPDLPPQAAVPSGERSGALIHSAGGYLFANFSAGAPVRNRGSRQWGVLHLRAVLPSKRRGASRPCVQAGRGYTGTRNS